MRKLIIFILILAVPSLACTISRNVPEIAVPPLSSSPTVMPSVTPTCTTIAQQTLGFGTVIVEVGLHLREKPTENSKTLIVLKPNSRIEIISEELNGWLCVSFSEIQEDFSVKEYIGFVNGDYVKR